MLEELEIIMSNLPDYKAEEFLDLVVNSMENLYKTKKDKDFVNSMISILRITKTKGTQRDLPSKTIRKLEGILFTRAKRYFKQHEITENDISYLEPNFYPEYPNEEYCSCCGNRLDHNDRLGRRGDDRHIVKENRNWVICHDCVLEYKE